MENNTVLKIVAGAVVFCALAAGDYAYYAKHTKSPIEVSAQVPYKELMQKDAHYTKASQLSSSGDYAGALVEYQLALESEQDFAFQQQILFSIATTKNSSGDALAAIDLYKQIAQNEANLPILRAYAIEYLGRIYYATRSPAVTNEIFKGAPFDQMRVIDNDALSYRHLFEYGSNIMPLALSELYIADWYATNINKAGSDVASSTRADAISIIDLKLANTDKEITRMSLSSSNELILIPEVLFEKAIVLGLASQFDPSVTPEAAENAYKQALNANGTLGRVGSDFYIRIFYASFLAEAYGSAREADIQAVLVPVYQSALDQHSIYVQFLLNSRAAGAAHRADLILLGQLDPQFKTFLISLGWHEEDFAPSTQR